MLMLDLFFSMFLNTQSGPSDTEMLGVFFVWISFFLRIGFIVFLGYLIYSIIQTLRILKLNKSKGVKIRLVLVSVVLCVCLLLGYTEPPAKIRVKKDNVSETFTYIKQNKDVFGEGQYFSTKDMFGWVSYWSAEECNSILEEIQITKEGKTASINWYPTYVFYDEVDDIKIFYEKTICTRWESLGHLPIDLLGVPDDCDYGISTMVYLISNNECVALSVNYSGFNPCFFLQFLNSPYFFYSPEIDFEEIISSIER